MITMMQSEWFPILLIWPVGGTIFSHIGFCPNHIAGNYPMIKMMKSDGNYPIWLLGGDDEIRIVPPLAYCATGGNSPMIRMMKSERLPLSDPFSDIALCPNHIESFQIFKFIFGVDVGIISILASPSGCVYSVADSRHCIFSAFWLLLVAACTAWRIPGAAFYHHSGFS